MKKLDTVDNPSSLEDVLTDYLRRVAAGERERLLARVKRKARAEYKMTPDQTRAYRRISDRDGLTRIEYLAEDWRVTNPMFSRGWLRWEERRGVMYVVTGERAPALRVVKA